MSREGEVGEEGLGLLQLRLAVQLGIVDAPLLQGRPVQRQQQAVTFTQFLLF